MCVILFCTVPIMSQSELKYCVLTCIIEVDLKIPYFKCQENKEYNPKGIPTSNLSSGETRVLDRFQVRIEF